MDWNHLSDMALCISNGIAVIDWTTMEKTHMVEVHWRMKAILKRNTVECFQRIEDVAVNKVQYRPPKAINVRTVYPMREKKRRRMLVSIAPYPKSSQFNLSDYFLEVNGQLLKCQEIT